MARLDFWPPGGRAYLVTGAQNWGFRLYPSAFGVGVGVWEISGDIRISACRLPIEVY